MIICGGARGESGLEYSQKARQLQIEGKHDQALELYSQGLRLEPSHPHAPEMYNNRGLIYFSRGDHGKAM